MQKLTTKLKNVPVDAPQVHCSTNTGLNRVERPRGQCSSKKNERASNNLEVDLPSTKTTFGYITNIIRNELGLAKTHYNDAFIIAGRTDQSRSNPTTVKQKCKNNRVLQLSRNGYASAIRKQRYSIQPGDLVSFVGNNRKYAIKGVHSYGTRVKVWDKEEVLDFKMNKIVKCCHQKTLMWIIERDSSHP